MRVRIISYILVAIIFLILGSVLTYKFMDSRLVERKIYIKGETKTITRYIKKANAYEELKKAYASAIQISGKMEVDNLFMVTATDGYKESKKGFKLGSKGNWKFYLAITGGTIAVCGLAYGGYKLYTKYK